MDGRLIINNERIESDDKNESINPSTLESLGEFSLASSTDCQKAVRAANEAFPTWSILSLKDKKALFMKAKAILLKRGEEAASLISKEKGSPLPESMMSEIQGGLETLDYYGRNLETILKPRKKRICISSPGPHSDYLPMELSIRYSGGRSDQFTFSRKSRYSQTLIIYSVYSPPAR